MVDFFLPQGESGLPGLAGKQGYPGEQVGCLVNPISRCPGCYMAVLAIPTIHCTGSSWTARSLGEQRSRWSTWINWFYWSSWSTWREGAEGKRARQSEYGWFQLCTPQGYRGRTGPKGDPGRKGLQVCGYVPLELSCYYAIGSTGLTRL